MVAVHVDHPSAVGASYAKIPRGSIASATSPGATGSSMTPQAGTAPGLPSARISRSLRRGPLSGISRLEIDSSANKHA